VEKHEAIALRDKLLLLFREELLLRRAWEGRDSRGRRMLCILAAMSDEVADKHNTASCPASLMPPWLADLTPWLDDAGTPDAWPAFVRRFADIVPRALSVLSGEDWHLLNANARLVAVESVLRYAKSASIARSLTLIAFLLQEMARGRRINQSEWEHARVGASLAWRRARNERTQHAARVGELACRDDKAMEALSRAASVVAIGKENEDIASEAAADQMISKFLDAIETALAQRAR
jgi:hypothetical protein